MNILLNFIFFVIILCKIKCQQVLNEELVISEQKAGEKVNIKKTNIERRFLEDLDDYEWHVAHLRNAAFDGRRNCMGDTFADKVRRYRRMLNSDGAKVNYVSADPLPVNPYDVVEDSCKVAEEPLGVDIKETVKDTSANILNVTNNNVNVSTTTTSLNETTANTTVSMEIAETTPKIDHKATPSPIDQGKKKPENATLNAGRRASEYMFSSVEYYDESVDFDIAICPEAVEVIVLDQDQLRSYDLECELTVEWRSLD